MSNETPALFTAGAIAKTLGVADAKVKEAIKALNIEPAIKKGCRAYFTVADFERVESLLK
jgi:hypothetical protein